MNTSSASTPTPRSNADPLLTVAEAAEYATVSPAFIYRLTSTQAIPAVRLGRAVRIRRSALDTYLRAAEAHPATRP